MKRIIIFIVMFVTSFCIFAQDAIILHTPQKKVRKLVYKNTSENEPILKPLRISSSIGLNTLNPTIMGTFQKPIGKYFNFNFMLNIQSPSNQIDTLDQLRRIFKLGGTGKASFSFSFMKLSEDKADGLICGAKSSIEYMSLPNKSDTSGNQVNPDFFFISPRIYLMGWYQVFFISVGLSYQFPFGIKKARENDFVIQELKRNKPVFDFSLSVLVENYYLNIGYVAPHKDQDISNQNFEIKLGYKLDFNL